MTSRWVLVFSVDGRHAPAVVERLEAELGAVVATEPDGPDRTVLSIEVEASETIVLAVSQAVRSFDVDAERLHDVVVPEPPEDAEVPTVFVDYDPDDEPAPCRTCAGWWHEVVVTDAGEKVLREWHRPVCPTYLASV